MQITPSPTKPNTCARITAIEHTPHRERNFQEYSAFIPFWLCKSANNMPFRCGWSVQTIAITRTVIDGSSYNTNICTGFLVSTMKLKTVFERFKATLRVQWAERLRNNVVCNLKFAHLHRSSDTASSQQPHNCSVYALCTHSRVRVRKCESPHTFAQLVHTNSNSNAGAHAL